MASNPTKEESQRQAGRGAVPSSKVTHCATGRQQHTNNRPFQFSICSLFVTRSLPSFFLTVTSSVGPAVPGGYSLSIFHHWLPPSPHHRCLHLGVTLLPFFLLVSCAAPISYFDCIITQGVSRVQPDTKRPLSRQSLHNKSHLYTRKTALQHNGSCPLISHRATAVWRMVSPNCATGDTVTLMRLWDPPHTAIPKWPTVRSQ